ncbi:MAG: hypothetical protein IT461_16590 [Planctomycetes bacterium]|nr:hypothetical protein [Planctomycetota bacterium]
MILIDANYDCEDVAERFWERKATAKLGDYIVDQQGVAWLYMGFHREGDGVCFLFVAGAVCAQGTEVVTDDDATCLNVNVEDMAVIVIESQPLPGNAVCRKTSLQLPGTGEPVLYG